MLHMRIYDAYANGGNEIFFVDMKTIGIFSAIEQNDLS